MPVSWMVLMLAMGAHRTLDSFSPMCSTYASSEGVLRRSNGWSENDIPSLFFHPQPGPFDPRDPLSTVWPPWKQVSKFRIL